VSMMLIELALLRLSGFKRLALLDTQGLELLVVASASLVGATGGTISLGQEKPEREWIGKSGTWG
jgi:hypothetical protein